MAINFPTSLDTLANPAPTDSRATVSLAGKISDLNDAVEALEAKVGADSSAVTSSLDYKVANKANSGATTASGLTMSTARLLGRSTASTGAIEEITVGSGLTLSSGTLSASGGGVTDYSVRVRKSSGQSIGSSLTAMSFDTEDFDTDTMHDNVTNNTRITFTHSGKYAVGGTITTAGNVISGLSIRLNGSTTIGYITVGNSTTNANNGCHLSTVYSFAANDYVELLGYFGSTQTTGNGSDGPQFWAYKIA
jgi:hypothetical protein